MAANLEARNTTCSQNTHIICTENPHNINRTPTEQSQKTYRMFTENKQNVHGEILLSISNNVWEREYGATYLDFGLSMTI